MVTPSYRSFLFSLSSTCIWVQRVIWSGVLILLLGASWAKTAAAADPQSYAGPRFEDSDRVSKVRRLIPEMDQAFAQFRESEHLPGLVYGIVMDGELVHRGALGFANLEKKVAADPDTGFRIASMSKSFVCLAAFLLRDEGKLMLDDAVDKFIPEFRNVRVPTSDSPRVTIRNLMTMTTGLPEDNPWGDRQMAITKKALRAFIRDGLSFSNPPGQQYEYSNLGFVLLGQVVSKASGMPFQKFIRIRLLEPLGMHQTRWEFSEFPEDHFAFGYRWEHETWTREPILHDGEGAACGGLITTLNDFAKYVRFHLSAWPARDEADSGPLKRATVREMQRPFVLSRFASFATLLDGTTPNPVVAFYGYGLGWSVDSHQVIALAHSGGLPGYGSYYRFLPDHGFGVIAFGNRTYTPASRVCGKVVQILLEKGGLRPRSVSLSPILSERAREVVDLVSRWEPSLESKILAENFFLDRSREDWMALSRQVFAKAGSIRSVLPISPENQLRGAFTIRAENGDILVQLTLTPERVPKIQELHLEFVAPR